jgi:uncharacterized repeat protein (TIGR03803 family)
MARVSRWRRVWGLIVVCGVMATAARAQVTLTTLVNFIGSNGSTPYMVLTQGADGSFYGTTYGGGTAGICDYGCGTLFKMTPEGTLTTLYNFCSQTDCGDGQWPIGSLVQAADGGFYGTTSAGGAHSAGTVFRITPAGKLTTLYSFCALANCADGEEPEAGLVQAANGYFYGTTVIGGNNVCHNGCGTVFKISSAGKLVTLHSFDGSDGDNPAAALLQANNGNFYGETIGGGPSGSGTIFKMTPGGKLTTLFSFDIKDGEYPNGGLVQSADGELYGVTQTGGHSQGCGFDAPCGTAFKISTDRDLVTLCNFGGVGCIAGEDPRGPLALGTDGSLYGALNAIPKGEEVGPGLIYEITAQGSVTTLYTFCSLPYCTDGDFPLAGMLQATNGTFYGSTGGSFEYGDNLFGTIFSLSVGLGPFVKTQPTFAKEGATVGIFGQGFDNSSVVQFGRVPATSLKLSGSTFLFAKVPAGALTGSVTVTTGATTLTSNQPFRVKPQVLSFDPPSGSVGTQVTITGTGFTQTNGVGFGDNIPAEFTVNSDTQITATVPTGAKTGPVGVATKGGTAVSTATFTVN